MAVLLHGQYLARLAGGGSGACRRAGSVLAALVVYVVVNPIAVRQVLGFKDRPGGIIRVFRHWFRTTVYRRGIARAAVGFPMFRLSG